MKIKLLPAAFMLLALALAASFAFPQTSTPAKPATKVNEALPQPSETELLKLENLQLKLTLITQNIQSIDEQLQRLPSQRDTGRKEQDRLAADYNALIKKIESEHPGFRWDAFQYKLAPIPTPTTEKGK